MKLATKTAQSLAFAALLAVSLGVSADSATSDADKKSGFSALPGVAAEQLAPTELDKVQGQRFKWKALVRDIFKILTMPRPNPCPYAGCN